MPDFSGPMDVATLFEGFHKPRILGPTPTLIKGRVGP